VNIQNHKFAFVVGLHASGTSTLSRMLKQHSQVSGFKNTGVPENEGQHLQTTIATAKSLGGPGMFAFHPDAVMDENHELANDKTRDALLHEWQHQWDPRKEILLEKSPPTIVRTRFFQSLFPQSHFICLTRHPIAVGYGTQMWSETTTEDLLDHWLKAHEQLSQDMESLDRVITLSYEGFLANPLDTIHRVQEFLGIEKEPAQLPEVIEPNDVYFEMWRELSNNSKGEFHRFVAKHESSFRSFGYSLSDLNWAGDSRLNRKN
jgi:adenylate kinase family enzyme